MIIRTHKHEEVVKHLKKDVKEAKSGIKRDKKLIKTMGKSKHGKKIHSASY